MTDFLSAFPSRTPCSDSMSWSVPPAYLVRALEPSRRRETACRFECSDVALTDRCRRPASTLLSWRLQRCFVLQTIVSREVAATDAAVVTVGSLQAGTKENVIPDEAIIKLNVRTFDEGVRKRVLAAIERIVNAEAEASGAPKKPEITALDRYPLVKNDPEATKRVGGRVSPATSRQTVCRKPSQRRPARTLARSDPNGARHPCSGL